MHLIQLRRLLSFHSARRVCSGCRFITAHRNVSSSLSGSSPVQLAYESIDASSYGEELPPLVILHGLFGSKTNWKTLGKHFHRETGRKIVTLDARNHGESEHSPEMNYFVQALDVCCLFQELELSKAVVMGHSMGGKTAMTLALSYPEYVQSLIVVDMSPTKVTLDDDIPQYLAAKRDMNLAFVNNKRDAERMLMNAVPNSFLRSFFLTNLVKSESGFKWRINLEGIESNISEVSGFPTQFPHQQFDGRTLFIGGSKSDYIQFKEFPSIKNLFPRASIKFIPDSGHWPHAEKPMEFAQIVTDFLDNCLQDHD